MANDLAELFPAAQASHQALYKVEASELGTNENLPVLREIASVVRSGWLGIGGDFNVRKALFITSFIKFEKE